MVRYGFSVGNDDSVFAAAKLAIEKYEFTSIGLGISCKDQAEKLRLRSLLENYFSASLGKKVVKENFELYLLLDCEHGIAQATQNSVCIEGRYNKFSRVIAQTFHYCFKCKGRGCSFCNFAGKLSENSVQELLEKKFLPAFGSRESKFHGCGREDVDVLMLGRGRPFVFEVIAPLKREIDLQKIEAEINSAYQGQISVSSLSFCPPLRIAQIKNTEFQKIYSAKCLCENGVTESDMQKLPGKEISILQRTPKRVELRRADLERQKSATINNAKMLNEKEFIVEVLASHGLYIKEFVSGDGGRTNPSISSLLGAKCRCEELDVLEILTKYSKWLK